MRHGLKEYGKRIQQLRKERELTQEQLAEKLNVSQNTIAKRRSSIDFLLEISEFFNVSTNYLVFGVHAEDVEDEKSKKDIDETIKKIDQTIEKLLEKKEKLLKMQRELN